MAKEKQGILQHGETLWDVALRGIGIQLPDEYVVRFCLLCSKANEVGLDKVTLSDLTDIEFEARKEVEKRTKREGEA